MEPAPHLGPIPKPPGHLLVSMLDVDAAHPIES